MQVGVIQSKLAWGINLASKIVSTKTNLPILSNLLLTTQDDNTLQIESSNLELSIRLKVPAKVSEPGRITIPARKFADYVSAVKEKNLELRVDKNQLTVKGERVETSFVTMPAGDFPDLPVAEKDASFLALKTSDFRHLTKKTVFATASRADQPVLTGVLFDFNGAGKLVCAASDSFRLSVTEMGLATDLARKIIVPAPALTEVDRLISDETNRDPENRLDELQISFGPDQNQIFFQVGQVEIVSRLLEAEFPDYNRLIPTEFATTGVFDRIGLLDAIRTTAIFSSREGQLIRVKFQPDAGKIQLTAQSSEVGSHADQLGGEIEGNEVELGFNSRYLIEGLGSIETSQVKLSVTDAKRPVLLEPVVESSSAGSGKKSTATYRHIIMPMDLEGRV